MNINKWSDLLDPKQEARLVNMDVAITYGTVGGAIVSRFADAVHVAINKGAKLNDVWIEASLLDLHKDMPFLTKARIQQVLQKLEKGGEIVRKRQSTGRGIYIYRLAEKYNECFV